MNPASTLFLIRCGQTSVVAEKLALALTSATKRLPVFVCDSRRGAVSSWDCPRIELTDTVLAGLGLVDRPQNWGWLCGDFCYYAAARAFPDYAQYCLLDSDVFMSDSTAKAFVSLLAATPNQALAVRLGRQASAPRYSRGLGMVGLSPDLGCIFPASRVHRDVIPVMLDLRQRTFKAPQGPPNDEAILAGAVALGGFSAAALDVIAPQLFGPDSFETNPPHLLDHVLKTRQDGRVYHPVVTAQGIIAQIRTGEKTYTTHRLRRVLRHAPPEIASQIQDALACGKAP